MDTWEVSYGIWTKVYGSSYVQRSLDGRLSVEGQGGAVAFFPVYKIVQRELNFYQWQSSILFPPKSLMVGKFLEEWLISLDKTFSWSWFCPPPPLRDFSGCHNWQMLLASGGWRSGILLGFSISVTAPQPSHCVAILWCQQCSSDEEHCSLMLFCSHVVFDKPQWFMLIEMV